MLMMYLARLRGWRFILFNAVLGLGHIVVLSNVGGYAVLVPYAAGSLEGVLPSFALWANTHFMVGLALGFPIARWLSGRFGDYRLFIAAFAIYALASFLCAVSESLWLFLPARILLGFAGGMSLPIGQALLVNEYPERIRSVGLGIWGVFTLMPFTIGIPLGGWIAENLGWRFLFYWNIPVALMVAGVTGSLLYGRGFHRRITRFDGIGFILLALILGGIQTILNQGNDFDWFASPFLSGVLATVIVTCLVLSFGNWASAIPRSTLDCSPTAISRSQSSVPRWDFSQFKGWSRFSSCSFSCFWDILPLSRALFLCP